METVYLLMSFIFGVMLVVAEMVDGLYPSPPVANLSQWQGFMMGGSLIIGSVLMFIGLLAPLPDLEAEYLSERTGLAFCILSWVTYALAVYIWDANYGGALLLGWGMAVMGATRLAITFIIKRDTHQLMRGRKT